MQNKDTSTNIVRLILLSLCGEINPDQQAQLEAWLSVSEKNRLLYDKLKSKSYREKQLQEFSSYQAGTDWPKVRCKLKRSKPFYLRWTSYAAILIVALGIGMVVRTHITKQERPLPVEEFTIQPGSHQALLILANGEKIDLKSQNNLNTASQDKDFVNDGQQLSYEQQRLSSIATEEKVEQWHTLQTPRGGEYQVLLSDGTRVWLNADTELSYPKQFIGKQRKVILKGEAYFEVATDSTKPFFVETAGMGVTVLGTSFDVSAYPDETIRTTLVQGSVIVNSGTQQIQIKPGQQAIKNEDGIEIKQVNPLNIVAWKDKRFVYENQTLEKILKDLQRWYNVDIEVADQEILKLHLTANLPKYENMDKVLEIIEYATCIRFEINTQKIIVHKN